MIKRTILFLLSVASGFAQTKVNFIRDVRPILAQKCFSCHGEAAQQAGLRLDRRQQALRGGDYGPVIVPGKSAESKLIRRVVNGDGGLQMPPTGPLSDEEIGILRAWIDEGADYRLEIEEAPAKPVDPKLAKLIAAVRSSQVDAVERLLAENNELIRAGDRAGSTPLHHAAGFGTPAMVKLLVDRGADVNAGNKRKSTPLFWALPDETKVRLLIEHGADVNGKTIDGRTPVYQAALMGDGVRILKLLLERGGAPDVKTITGMTPLMAAASRANVEAMRILIERHVDVNARNGAGATALMDAALTGNAQAVRLLLEKGDSTNLKTKKNEIALAFAATAGVEETFKLLLDRTEDIDVRDIRGYSPLLYAAGSDAMPAGIVRLLLSRGANATAEGDGETARMLAAKRGDTEVARLLGAPQAERTSSSADPRKEGRLGERPIAEAVGPALALLEKQSRNFIRIGGCNSCHAQDLPSAAVALARDRGLPAPKEIPQLPQHMHANTAERLLDLNSVAPSGIALAWELFDFGMNGVARDEYTDAVVHYLIAMQAPEGNWRTFGSRRPPMSSGESQAAALSIYAIRRYGRSEDHARNAGAISRAASWLERNVAPHTQDRAFRLLGLGWAEASPAAIAAAARELATSQCADGGWSQLEGLATDAYATGEALYALRVGAKMPAADPVYRKGIAYLLRTQAEDGSWHVNSRSIWLQPYFESGFPYGRDQWISTAGTAWAVMALAGSL